MSMTARRIAAALAGARAARPLTPDIVAEAWRGLRSALRRERDARRLFLWTPAAVGAGVIGYFSLTREPPNGAALGALGLAFVLALVCVPIGRFRSGFLPPLFAVCGILCGFAFGRLRAEEVDAPALDRIRIVSVAGFIEELDPRPNGARLVLRIVASQGFGRAGAPFRIRVTTRRHTDFQAGDYVAFKSRLLPPSRAVMPGGYDFARDAYFTRLGGVGTVLGPIRAASAPAAPPLALRFFAAVDRARNALAFRIARTLQEPAASVAIAMVTGKRDFLADDTKDVIRQAGIFHIITISGVQMTLVAGVAFWTARRLFSFSRTLALRFPIKAWSALVAMAVATGYDLATGGRIGAQRAWIMTLVMLGAVLCGRRALSMRNLALAALIVICLEPEAVLGASFQLSFSAVTALVAVQEARRAGAGRRAAVASLADRKDLLIAALERLRHGPGALLFATFCATCATASFVAYDFHELSPYVVIGNPLTLAVIEFFAVPCALVGALLYPLGLDALAWRYLGAGINFILWVAAKIAAAPGASLHLPAFEPWALACLATGFLGLAIWTTAPMRSLSAPLIALGLIGAAATRSHFMVEIAPSGDVVAVRAADGLYAVMGRKPSAFLLDQWLSADGDDRPRAQAFVGRSGDLSRGVRCDRRGCVAETPQASVALVLDMSAFDEPCAQADVIISPYYAPRGCGAALILDRARLAQTGAVSLQFDEEKIETAAARAPGEDRPWSPAP